MRDFKKEFVNCLGSIDYSKNDYEVFSDFLEVSALALANSIYQRQDYEQAYFNIIDRYKDPNKFAELLAIMAQTLEINPYQDFLGKIFESFNFKNRDRGQYFTPYNICQMMAEITLGSKEAVKRDIAEKRYLKLSEPCAGAGNLIIAYAEAVHKLDINPQENIWFQAIDLDRRCFNMTYIHTSLIGLAGDVLWGNTLSYEMYREYSTPMTASPLWAIRFPEKAIDFALYNPSIKRLEPRRKQVDSNVIDIKVKKRRKTVQD